MHGPWVLLKFLVCYSVCHLLTRNNRIQRLIGLSENFSSSSHASSLVSQEFSEEAGY